MRRRGPKREAGINARSAGLEQKLHDLVSLLRAQHVPVTPPGESSTQQSSSGHVNAVPTHSSDFSATVSPESSCDVQINDLDPTEVNNSLRIFRDEMIVSPHRARNTTEMFSNTDIAIQSLRAHRRGCNAIATQTKISVPLAKYYECNSEFCQKEKLASTASKGHHYPQDGIRQRKKPRSSPWDTHLCQLVGCDFNCLHPWNTRSDSIKDAPV